MKEQKKPSTKIELTGNELDQITGGKGEEDYCTCVNPSYKTGTGTCLKCGKKRKTGVRTKEPQLR